MIELQNVSKKFGLNTFALENINLKILDHEFVFIVGPTGSGKTTFLKLLTHEIVPSTGTIVIDGESIAKLSSIKITKLRRKIGVIYQDFKLLFDRTVFENVMLPLEIIGLSSKEITRRVNYILDLVNLARQKNLFPSQLSGGEMQRAAIARAIIMEPNFILADEPTGNLDPATGWDIMKLLRDINKTSNVTVIVSTHNMDAVNSLGKRIVRLENGKIIKDEKQIVKRHNNENQ
jgi:cell division transport system ATP-binding protein